MYHHFFQIFLFLRFNKQSITESSINPTKDKHNDKLMQKEIFEDEMAKIKNSFDEIKHSLFVKRYKLKREKLIVLEIKVDELHQKLRKLRKSWFRKFIKERAFDKHEYYEEYYKFKATVYSFKNSQKYYLKIEEEKILDDFQNEYKKVINEFDLKGKIGLDFNNLKNHVNDLDRENRRYYLEIIKSRMRNFKEEYISCIEIYDFICKANRYAQELVKK